MLFLAESVDTVSYLMQIVFSALGIIVTGLVTFGVTKFTQWINLKINDKKAANYLSTIMSIVGNSVKSVYQTYVQSLKDQDVFDKNAQEEALQRCLKSIESQLAPELIEYITNNFGDMNEYLKTLIESVIYSLKN